MGKSDKRFYKISRAKTFYKGGDYGAMIDWFVNQIETHDYQPEGTCMVGGEPTPYDPVCELKKKYVIVIKEVR